MTPWSRRFDHDDDDLPLEVSEREAAEVLEKFDEYRERMRAATPKALLITFMLEGRLVIMGCGDANDVAGLIQAAAAQVMGMSLDE